MKLLELAEDELLRFGGQLRYIDLPHVFWPIWQLLGPLFRKIDYKEWYDHSGCPHCHYYFDIAEDDEWFKCIEAGKYSTFDGTVYWFRGMQTCPRCRYKFYVEDST